MQGRRVIPLSRRQINERDAREASAVAADYLADLKRDRGEDAQDAAERAIIDADDDNGEGDHDDNGGETGAPDKPSDAGS